MYKRQVEKAVAEILSQAGRQFDPGVVDAFSTLDHPTLLTRVKDWNPPHNSQSPHLEGRGSVHA